MSTFRTNKRENPFVQIDKYMLEDENLSWKAKGILCYLLSKPNDWKTRLKDLEKKSKDGRDSTSAGIQELLNAGYLHRTPTKKKGGQFDGYDYEVFERPEFNPYLGDEENPQVPDSPNPDSPISEENQIETVAQEGNTVTDFPHRENRIGKTVNGKPDTTNNNITDNEFTNTNTRRGDELSAINKESIILRREEFESQLINEIPRMFNYFSERFNQDKVRQVLSSFWQKAKSLGLSASEVINEFDAYCEYKEATSTKKHGKLESFIADGLETSWVQRKEELNTTTETIVYC